jgi:hypothetical protein
MNRRLRVVAVGGLTVLASLGTAVLAPPAGAGGISSLEATKGVLGDGADPYAGVVDPDAGQRYTAILGPSGTAVQRINTDGGSIERTRFIDGEAAIPAVAWDGSPGGLSADGSTLALAEPGLRFPQRDSSFTVLDTDRLRTLDTVTLDGTWTYDALSPDGRWLYLIEYTSRTDLTEYAVRRYDLERGRLDPQAIVDPEESGEEMYGSPMTRATSPDGRWAYTLYDGAEHPFIHALDTERGAAVCIDLDPGAVSPRRLSRMSLDPSRDGSTLTVTDPKEGPVAIVDTRSFDLSQPAISAPADDGQDSGGAPWLAIALGALGVAAISVGVLRWRRRAGRVHSEELERLVRVGSTSEAKPETDIQEKERDWHRVS